MTSVTYQVGDPAISWFMRIDADNLTCDGPALTRTVLFSDVVSSTELIDDYGDGAWYELVSQHARTVEAAARDNGGTIVNFLGDGFMVLFDHPVDAMACATRLQCDSAAQGQLSLRIGIDHGDVYPFREDWWIGLTIHVASRLTDLCEGGEIAISDRCVRETQSALQCRGVEVRLVAIRGLLEPWLVHLVTPIDAPDRRAAHPSARPVANSAP